MSAVPEDGTILGVNIRWLVVAPHAMDRSMGYCVVLVADEDGDYAAYAGIITGIKEGTTTWASVKASKHQDAMTNEAQLSLEDMTPGPVTGHVSPREPLKKK